MAPPGGHMFYIGLYRENVKQSSCLKPEGIDNLYLVFSSPSRPLPSLFKLLPWAKNGLVLGVTCLSWAYIGKM